MWSGPSAASSSGEKSARNRSAPTPGARSVRVEHRRRAGIEPREDGVDRAVDVGSAAAAAPTRAEAPARSPPPRAARRAPPRHVERVGERRGAWRGSAGRPDRRSSRAAPTPPRGGRGRAGSRPARAPTRRSAPTPPLPVDIARTLPRQACPSSAHPDAPSRRRAAPRHRQGVVRRRARPRTCGRLRAPARISDVDDALRWMRTKRLGSASSSSSRRVVREEFVVHEQRGVICARMAPDRAVANTTNRDPTHTAIRSMGTPARRSAGTADVAAPARAARRRSARSQRASESSAPQASASSRRRPARTRARRARVVLATITRRVLRPRAERRRDGQPVEFGIWMSSRTTSGASARAARYRRRSPRHHDAGLGGEQARGAPAESLVVHEEHAQRTRGRHATRTVAGVARVRRRAAGRWRARRARRTRG